jgi:hypothetical protein
LPTRGRGGCTLQFVRDLQLITGFVCFEPLGDLWTSTRFKARPSGTSGARYTREAAPRALASRSAILWKTFTVAAFLIRQNTGRSASLGGKPNAHALADLGTLLTQLTLERGLGRTTNLDAGTLVAATPAERDTCGNLICLGDVMEIVLRETLVTSPPSLVIAVFALGSVIERN